MNANEIPIEIVNKIMVYIGELNNDVIITQYNIVTKAEFFKINFYSDLLWNIKSVIFLKQLYPLNFSCPSEKRNQELYKSAKPHYANILRQISNLSKEVRHLLR